MAPGASLGGAPSDASKTDFPAAAEAGTQAGLRGGLCDGGHGPAVGFSEPRRQPDTHDQQAQPIGYADVVAPDYPDVLTKMNLPSPQLVPVPSTPRP